MDYIEALNRSFYAIALRDIYDEVFIFNVFTMAELADLYKRFENQVPATISFNDMDRLALKWTSKATRRTHNA